MWSRQVEVSIQKNDKDKLVQLFKNKKPWQANDDDLSFESLALEIPEDRAKDACWYSVGGTSSSKYKCRKNADKPRCSPLHVAAVYGNEETIHILRDYCPVDCEDSYGATPLMYACWRGNLNAVKLLVSEMKSDVNYRGMVSGPLHEACEQGHRDIVEWLLTIPKININTRTRFSNETALMKARSSKHSEIIALLIAKGASDEHHTQSSENVPRNENTTITDTKATIDRITSLEQTVAGFTNQITNINNKAEKFSITIRNLSDGINTVSKTVAVFETDFEAKLSVLNKSVNRSHEALEEKLAITNKEINDLKAAKTNLTDTLAKAQTHIKKLFIDIDNNKQNASAINEITEKIIAMQDDIEKCNQQVTSTNGIVTTLKETIETRSRQTNEQFVLMSQMISEVKQR